MCALQWDLPERLHHTYTDTRLPLPLQPGTNVSHTLHSTTCPIQTRWKQLLIWAAGKWFAFPLGFTGSVCHYKATCLILDFLSSWRMNEGFFFHACLLTATDKKIVITDMFPVAQCRISTAWDLLKKAPSLTCPSWNICKSLDFYVHISYKLSRWLNMNQTWDSYHCWVYLLKSVPVCVAASDAPSLCNTINAQLANGLMLQTRKRANEIL